MRAQWPQHRGVVRANELANVSEDELQRHLDSIIDTMMDSIDRGMRIEGLLPGRLQVPRRARGIPQKLDADRFRTRHAPPVIMAHVSVLALAVNEETPAGGRGVTAPTNGAPGAVPAVLLLSRPSWPET